MLLKQISVFISNKKGSAARLTNLLADNNVNIKAMAIADSETFGIVRFIVDNPEEVLELVKGHNFTVKTTDVIAVDITDNPGALSKILNIIKEADLSVEYLYSNIRTHEGNAVIILKLSDLDSAIEVLKSNAIRVLSGSEFRAL